MFRQSFSKILLLITLLTSSVLAQNFTYIDQMPKDPNSNMLLGEEQAIFKYNSDTEELEFSLNYSHQFGPFNQFRIGQSPINFLQILINNGTASGTSGEQAILVIDATTPGSPKLSVYAFNGNNIFCFLFPASFQEGKLPSGAADTILSSNDTSWVLSTTDITTATSRTLGAKIKITDILQHVPLHPSGQTWKGMGFGPNISVQAYATTIFGSPTYDLNGFITNVLFGESNCPYYALDNIQVNQTPSCSSSLQGITVSSGEKVAFDITGTDPDNDTIQLTYSGAPTAATVTPAQGSYNGSVTVQFEWTPVAANAGENHTFTATFEDPFGHTSSCNVNISVSPNAGPTCVITGALENQVCLGPETPNSLSGIKSSDPNGDTLSYLWDFDCNGDAFLTKKDTVETSLVFTGSHEGSDVECAANLTVSDGTLSTSCKATTSVKACPVCNSTDVASDISLLDGNSFALSKMVRIAASELARINETNKLPTSVRNLVKTSKDLHIEAWQAINNVPSVIINSCSSSTTCVNVSHISSIEQFTDISTQLLENVEKVTRRVRRSVKKNGTSGFKRRSRWRRIRNSARNLDDTNQAEASFLPLSSTVCAFTRNRR